METKRRVGKSIVARLESFADSLERGEPIGTRYTVRKVVLNLRPQSYGPPLVKQTRALLGASQRIFAQFLGVSPQTVRAWEQGENSPSDMACRFMDEIRHNPDYYRARLSQAAQPRARARSRG